MDPGILQVKKYLRIFSEVNKIAYGRSQIVSCVGSDG
jgi:hypothetical protein